MTKRLVNNNFPYGLRYRPSTNDILIRVFFTRELLDSRYNVLSTNVSTWKHFERYNGIYMRPDEIQSPYRSSENPCIFYIDETRYTRIILYSRSNPEWEIIKN